MIQGADLELFRRTVEQATQTHTGDALDTALMGIGWLDALADDPAAAISCLFRAQGYANARSSALDWVINAGAGDDDPTSRGVVLPRGLALASIRSHPAARLPGGEIVDTASLTLRPVSGLDPSLELVEVLSPSVGPIPPTGWARVAVGYEMAGAARRMIELARDHALERVQFGRPIAQFQAVRHRLAEAYVAVEGAEALLDASAAAGPDDDFTLADAAHAVSSKAARTAARHCQQVLAGIGFTAEHPFHCYFRRVLALDQLLGSARSFTWVFGANVLDNRALPNLLAL